MPSIGLLTLNFKSMSVSILASAGLRKDLYKVLYVAPSNSAISPPYMYSPLFHILGKSPGLGEFTKSIVTSGSSVSTAFSIRFQSLMRLIY